MARRQSHRRQAFRCFFIFSALTEYSSVVTLLIVNINNLPSSQFDVVFKAVGLDAISFEPTVTPVTASGWPTLGSMIDSGKRLVTFLDNGASPDVPYLLDGKMMSLKNIPNS